MTLLYSILTVCVFVILLCLFIVFSEKALGQSGNVEVSLNEFKSFETKRGIKLIQALKEHDVFLPVACGGKGNCGRCKIRINSGGGYVTSLEKSCLSEKEIAENYRLACQIKLKENISLDIPNILLKAKSFKAKLINSRNLAYKIKELVFKIEDEVELDYQSGQYLQITRKLPNEDVIRAYSLSSSPKNRKEFSLDVQLVDGGIMSNYLHSLEIGTTIEFCGPFGDMSVDINSLYSTETVVLVAGGVGLAPMRAIISYLIEVKYSGKIILFHGVRCRKYLYSEEEYRNLENKNNNFCYYPVLSEPALEDGWIGKTGFVTDYLNEWLDNNKNDLNSIEVFLCGPVAMMEKANDLIKSKNINMESVHSDPFSF